MGWVSFIYIVSIPTELKLHWDTVSVRGRSAWIVPCCDRTQSEVLNRAVPASAVTLQLPAAVTQIHSVNSSKRKLMPSCHIPKLLGTKGDFMLLFFAWVGLELDWFWTVLPNRSSPAPQINFAVPSIQLSCSHRNFWLFPFDQWEMLWGRCVVAKPRCCGAGWGQETCSVCWSACSGLYHSLVPSLAWFYESILPYWNQMFYQSTLRKSSSLTDLRDCAAETELFNLKPHPTRQEATSQRAAKILAPSNLSIKGRDESGSFQEAVWA